MIENQNPSRLETADTKLKVAVLTGGIGAERDVSLASGRCVAEALQQAGYYVVTADIRPDNLDILNDCTIDVFFPTLHGQFGEDGQLQRILEGRSLVYTGSDSESSELAFDKTASKKLFGSAGVKTPWATEFDPELDPDLLAEQLRAIARKYVVKPVKQGSSVGVSIVSGPKETVAVAQETFEEFGDCMIEEFVSGKEVTVGILRGRALPVLEIRAQSGFYDYDAKYVDERTEYLFDTITDPATSAGISQAAVDCFNVLGCRHFARVDFILGNDQIAQVLELNTIPGFTSHSLLPKAASKAGLPMSSLCASIVEAARSSFAAHRA